MEFIYLFQGPEMFPNAIWYFESMLSSMSLGQFISTECVGAEAAVCGRELRIADCNSQWRD